MDFYFRTKFGDAMAMEEEKEDEVFIVVEEVVVSGAQKQLRV